MSLIWNMITVNCVFAPFFRAVYEGGMSVIDF